MKKLTILILCLITCSCEKEDSEPRPRYSATGTYHLESGGKVQRIYSGENNEYRKQVVTDLYNECSSNSTITINADGTFQKLDFIKQESYCESKNLSGTWRFKELLHSNELGEFKVNNSNQVFEIFSKATNSMNYTVHRIDVTYGSIDEGRYIFTYARKLDL